MNSAQRWLNSPKTQLGVLVAVVISLVLGFMVAGVEKEQIDRNNRYTACIAQYNDVSRKATLARVAINNRQVTLLNDENTTTASLILGVFAAKTQEQALAVFATYSKSVANEQKRQQAIDADKAANSLPNPPSESCH